MSAVPFETQLGHNAITTQDSQLLSKFVLVYTSKMTERQSALMKDCQHYLSQDFALGFIIQENELETLSPQTQYFVIPTLNHELIKRIKDKFEMPFIYLPRIVIEARAYRKVNLPKQKLSISLTMDQCHIYLVQDCLTVDLLTKIHEMSGYFANFKNPELNVVISNKANNKSCARALKRKIPVVSPEWVHASYKIALEEESGYFDRRSNSLIDEHKIKPFFGHSFTLVGGDKFKILTAQEVKELIINNHGNVIYGREKCVDHIVAPSGLGVTDDGLKGEADSNAENSSEPPRVVDEEFLMLCVERGYYIGEGEYNKIKDGSNVIIKQEKRSQEISSKFLEEGRTQLKSDNYSSDISESQDFLPPQTTRPLRHQPDYMNDMILKALSTPAQTQIASTQMRRLPDPELRIEQTYEPSQHLYWNDSVSRKN